MVVPAEFVPRFVSGIADASANETAEEIAMRRKQRLRLAPLVAVLFASSVGGGFGFEDAVGAAGPLVTIIFCLIIPWVWCLPTGLAVSELATSVRSSAGILMWINVAFSPIVSFMSVMASMFIVFSGNAAFASLGASYVSKIYPMGWQSEALVKTLIVAISAWINILGLNVVGSMSIVISVGGTIPFIWYSVEQLTNRQSHWATALYVPEMTMKQWATFISVASWNFANIENIASLVREIWRPREVLPRAMVILMFSTYLIYPFPVLAGAIHSSSFRGAEWTAGFFTVIAQRISGNFVGGAMFVGGLLSCVGNVITSVCCTSRSLAGIGEMEVFPVAVSRLLSQIDPCYGTPVAAIALNSAVTLLLSITLDFTQVVAMCQTIYCLRLLLVFVAVIRLRIEYPALRRPYALPCGTLACALFLAPAFLFSLIGFTASARQSDAVWNASIIFILSALLLAFVRSMWDDQKLRGSIEYVSRDNELTSSSSGSQEAL